MKLKLIVLGMACASAGIVTSAIAIADSKALAGANTPGVTALADEGSKSTDPISDDAMVDIDDTVRFLPTTRPTRPAPSIPELSTPKNVDSGRVPFDWQRATDDWFGVRPWLDDRGIALNAGLYSTFGKNLRGGAGTRDQLFDYLFNFNVTLDTQRLFGFDGGTAFFSFQHGGGDDFSDSVGDSSGVSDLSEGRHTQLSEIFYQQKLGEKVRLKAGKIDAGSEFGVSEPAADFINDSFEGPATLIGLPGYPDTAFGGMIEVTPCESFSAMAGVFDGAAQEGVHTGSRGPSTLFGAPADLYWIGEASWHHKLVHGLPGRVAVGAFYHTGTFERFDGTTADGTTGAYFIVDQMLMKEEPDNDEDLQSLSIFVRGTIADRNVAEVPWSLAAGLNWIGAIPTRDDDVLGVGISYNGFSNSAQANFGGDELDCECFYKVQLTRYCYVKPDLQYITHPSGAFPDALLAAVRVGIEF